MNRANRLVHGIRTLWRADERADRAGISSGCTRSRTARARRTPRHVLHDAHLCRQHASPALDRSRSDWAGARAQPGSLLVANHPSLIDALILLGYVEDGVVVAKRSLQVNPFTWGGIRGADYVVNADPLALIDECRARIAAGETLILFPECTRTGDADRVPTSTATVTRVAQWLRHGTGGYGLVLDRVKRRRHP